MPTSVLTGSVPLPEARYADPVKRRQFAETVLTQLKSSPAVPDPPPSSMTFQTADKFSSRASGTEGVQPTESNAVRVIPRPITPNALAVLRVPLVTGRALTSADDERAPPAAVVSQAVVRKFWPNASPLGRRFRLASDGPLIAVVGVVGDVKQDWIPMFAPDHAIDMPFAQTPPMSFAFVVRTVGDSAELGAKLRVAVQAADPHQPVVELRMCNEGVLADKVAGLRFVGNTLAIIAGVSALLSSVGLAEPDVVPDAAPHARDRRARRPRGNVVGRDQDDGVNRLYDFTVVGVVVGLALSYLAGARAGNRPRSASSRASCRSRSDSERCSPPSAWPPATPPRAVRPRSSRPKRFAWSDSIEQFRPKIHLDFGISRIQERYWFNPGNLRIQVSFPWQLGLNP